MASSILPQETENVNVKSLPITEARFYQISELMRITGLSARTLIRQINAKKIPSMRIGRKHLVPKSFFDSPASQSPTTSPAQVRN